MLTFPSHDHPHASAREASATAAHHAAAHRHTAAHHAAAHRHASAHRHAAAHRHRHAHLLWRRSDVDILHDWGWWCGRGSDGSGNSGRSRSSSDWSRGGRRRYGSRRLRGGGSHGRGSGSCGLGRGRRGLCRQRALHLCALCNRCRALRLQLGSLGCAILGRLCCGHGCGGRSFSSRHRHWCLGSSGRLGRGRWSRLGRGLDRGDSRRRWLGGGLGSGLGRCRGRLRCWS